MATLAGNLVPHPHHFPRPTMESTDGSVSMDSSDNFDKDSLNIDDASCCSDDTVLSVGNETPVSDCKSEILSFKNIENHLNAISHITNSTLAADASTARSSSSPVHSLFSPSSTNSSSNFRHRTAENVSRSPGSTNSSSSTHKDFSDDEANNARLKFSIDNILKADFGRRITDPIKIRKTVPKRVVPECREDSRVSAPIDLSKNEEKEKKEDSQPILWPAWVYCTRYSDRPSSGRSKFILISTEDYQDVTCPRTRRPKKPAIKPVGPSTTIAEEKRPRTAFSGAQLARLKHEFAENRYLTEKRRQQLSGELGLNEAQIKIWFQNKRAKIKKASGQKNPLALQLMAQGLYNHSTIPLSKEEEEMQDMHDHGGS